MQLLQMIASMPARFSAGIWILCCCSALPLAANTLQEQLDSAVSAFGEGQYSAAYWQFENMELDYGTEPEFVDAKFQSLMLPVRAYAALMADRPTDALVYFEALLRSHRPSAAVQAFAIYNIAVAQAETNALDAAAQTYRLFQQRYPGSNEAALAALQEADIRYQLDDIGEANQLLDVFYASAAPQSLRMQARLRALQIASEHEQVERTLQILFETDWQVADMPDIAVLSFAALDAGDLLLNQGKYKQAIRAYRLCYPRDELIIQQRERLLTAQRALADQSLLASSIWKSHSRQLIARLERQLERLEIMADYTSSLFLRSGQAYLLVGRFREATILFRTVALSESFDADIRAESHYRWILALCEAEAWTDARQTARYFLELHPGHSLAQEALFLIARSYQGEGDYLEAITVLDDLILNFPKDPQAARWYFTRGYNYCVLERYADARENFSEGIDRFPKSNLVEQTKLWWALTYFFEKNYAESLQRLNGLKAETKQHPIQPEVCFRIANVLYADREYDSALEAANQLIETFPDHHRVPEMQALRGDIYMGLGELILAANAFKQVPADDARLYDYAVFQTTKIYKALERYDLMRSYLEAYVARDDADERPRVSEAIYWIGWSLQQEEHAQEAFPIYESALDRFGNDPQARSVESILSAYAQLYKRHRPANMEAAADFDTWLNNAIDQSLSATELTWFARLTHFKAQAQRAARDTAAAEATLLSIHQFVPIDQQDPPTLAAVGQTLAERGYDSADDYFEQILTEYPDRFERAHAYYGKAVLAAKQDQLESARRWLIRFMEETPTHPLAADARLLAADILTRKGLYFDAQVSLNEILQLKEIRGRPHARALAGLARIETETDRPKRAIAYWQRLYTLYRAYPDLLAEAYWESAQLFAQLDDYVAARNTVEEMQRDPRLQDAPEFKAASEKLPEYRAAAQAQSELSANAPTETEEQP